MKQILLFLFVLLATMPCLSKEKFVIDLSGKWTIRLDSTDTGIHDAWFNVAFDDKINLPSSA